MKITLNLAIDAELTETADDVIITFSNPISMLETAKDFEIIKKGNERVIVLK